MNGFCVCDTVPIKAKPSTQHGCAVTFNGRKLKCKTTWCFRGALLHQASKSSGTGAAAASLSFKENKKTPVSVFHFGVHMPYLAFGGVISYLDMKQIGNF